HRVVEALRFDGDGDRELPGLASGLDVLDESGEVHADRFVDPSGVEAGEQFAEPLGGGGCHVALLLLVGQLWAYVGKRSMGAPSGSAQVGHTEASPSMCQPSMSRPSTNAARDCAGIATSW